MIKKNRIDFHKNSNQQKNNAKNSNKNNNSKTKLQQNNRKKQQSFDKEHIKRMQYDCLKIIN